MHQSTNIRDMIHYRFDKSFKDIQNMDILWAIHDLVFAVRGEIINMSGFKRSDSIGIDRIIKKFNKSK